MAASLNPRQRDLLRRIADGHRPDSDEAASVVLVAQTQVLEDFEAPRAAFDLAP